MTSYEEQFRKTSNEGVKDCAVLAVASVCAISYLAAHYAFEVVGRARGGATSYEVTRHALRFLGFEVRREWTAAELALEVRATKVPALADLEGKDWLPRLLVFVNDNDHIAPFFHGHVQDWSANTEAKIDKAWEVAKPGVAVKAKTPPVIYL